MKERGIWEDIDGAVMVVLSHGVGEESVYEWRRSWVILVGIRQMEEGLGAWGQACNLAMYGVR